MKKVLITGGAGFVGSTLGSALHHQGYDVTLLDNMRFGYLDNLYCEGKSFGKFLGRDIRDPDLCSCLSGIDCVFHFAGIAPLPVCQADPVEAYDVNVTGTANVLESARRANVKRIIFSSTSAVYECSETEPHCEHEVVTPNLIYASTKFAAENLCRGYAQNYGMDIVICRFFNVYGAHQDMKRKSPPFTSYVARELSANRIPILYNKSSARRDYIHADDVTNALQKMMLSPKNFSAEIFNLGSGNGYSVPEIYQQFLKASGKNIQPEYRDPKKFWENYPSLFEGTNPLSASRVEKEVYKNSVADITKIKKEFAWSPMVEISDGIASVYQYCLRHGGEA